MRLNVTLAILLLPSILCAGLLPTVAVIIGFFLGTMFHPRNNDWLNTTPTCKIIPSSRRVAHPPRHRLHTLGSTRHRFRRPTRPFCWRQGGIRRRLNFNATAEKEMPEGQGDSD